MSRFLGGVGASLVVAATALSASPARADEGDKNPRTAQALSGVGAGVSSAVILSAFLVGDGTTYRGDWTPGHVNMPLLYAGLGVSMISPSIGEMYAGQYLTWGEGVRVGAAVMALIGVEQNEPTRCEISDDPRSQCEAITKTGVVLLSLAAIAYVGGVAYDVLDADEAAERHNTHNLMFTPTANMAGGTTSVGLLVSGTF